MADEPQTIMRRHIDVRWQEEAAHLRAQTETRVVREIFQFQAAPNDPHRTLLQGTIARLVRDEGIRLGVRRLHISLKALAEAGDKVTPDWIAYIESTVRAALRDWADDRTSYLDETLHAIAAEPSPHLISEVFWQVTRAIEREIEITKARFLLAASSFDNGAAPHDLVPRRVLEPEARDLVAHPALADGLARLDPALADSYRQVVADLRDSDRLTYLGPVAEIREIVRTVIFKLAPSPEVCPWLDELREQPIGGPDHPSKAQRVRYICYRNQTFSKANPVARAADNLLDNMIPGFIANWYERGALGEPASSAREEAVRLFRYADSLLNDLLPTDAPTQHPVHMPTTPGPLLSGSPPPLA